MATANASPRTFLANAAISAFRGVVLSNNGGVGYSTDTAMDGIALIDGASGDYIPVRLVAESGSVKIAITATPVTVADSLYLAVTGYVSTTGTVLFGKSLTTTGNTQNGAFIEALPSAW